MKTFIHPFFKRTAAGAVVLTLGVSHLTAAAIFDSLVTPYNYGAQINGGTDWTDPFPLHNSFYSYAGGFVVGGTDRTLTSVVLGIGATGSGGGFSVALYSAGSGTPEGTLIANLSGSSNPSTRGLYTYTPTGTTTLAANTTYYVVAAGSVHSGGFFTQPSAYYWNYGLASPTTGAYATTPAYENSEYGWNKFSSPFTGDYKFSFQVNAADLSPVPEPSEWAAASVALLGLVYVAKRRFAQA